MVKERRRPNILDIQRQKHGREFLARTLECLPIGKQIEFLGDYFDELRVLCPDRKTRENLFAMIDSIYATFRAIDINAKAKERQKARDGWCLNHHSKGESEQCKQWEMKKKHHVCDGNLLCRDGHYNISAHWYLALKEFCENIGFDIKDFIPDRRFDVHINPLTGPEKPKKHTCACKEQKAACRGGCRVPDNMTGC
jgi:hypothetical protein